MAAKLLAVPLPDLRGKRVLDIGCDMGGWSFRCADFGAARVLGLDRNREVKGLGHFDLIEFCQRYAQKTKRDAVCRFSEINLGKQWHEFGRFDVILCLSMYHHWYEQCGDHLAIWFWLWRHIEPIGELLWENPVDDSDAVVMANVSANKRANYNRFAILSTMQRYFLAEYIGPALHEKTREVWRFRPKDVVDRLHSAVVVPGAGGATKAFNYHDGRRINEIENILGFRPKPGSLNLNSMTAFDWDSNYYRAQISDVVDRSRGIESEWAPRWARFYPVTIEGWQAFAFRFEGEIYQDNFIELIAGVYLKDVIHGEQVVICH